MLAYLWIAIGGALGSVGRFWFSGVVGRQFGETFPWGTLLVNVSGSFAIGFLAALAEPGGRRFIGPTGPPVLHVRPLRRLHDLFVVQPADPGIDARRGLVQGGRQRGGLGRSVPGGRLARVCPGREFQRRERNY